MFRRSVLLCRRRRADAEGDRRAGDDRHEPGWASWPHLHEPHDQGLPGVLRFLRDGRDDRAHRRLLPPRRAGARGAQADPLSARPGRRRQILARRAAEAADGERAGLCAEGRQGDQPGLREPARPVRSDDVRRRTGKALRHSAAAADRHALALGGQAARRVRRRHHQIHRRADAAVAAASRSASPRPSPATRTTRTSRAWSARSISASSSSSARTIPTPIPIRAGSTARPRGCSNSSRCSRPRSRCCIRC